MSAIAVKCNSFSYEGMEKPVLQNVCFHVEYGEVTLLSGTSGSGKSTLLALINGVIPRMTAGELDGEVCIDGVDMKGAAMSQISSKVGSVLQNAEAQIIHQVVEDEVAFGCENFGVAPDEIARRVDACCDALHLSKEAATRTLSGGQKQRLVTAAALAMDTNILIFDEPLANLDQEGAIALLKLMRQLAEQGKAILLVEHRLDVVLPYVDVVWQVKDAAVEKVVDKKQYLMSQVSVIKDEKSQCPTGDPKVAFSVDKVSKKYGKRQILQELSMEIKAGERVLLLGENGCGKSTLMQLMARLIKPDGGTITQFLDRNVGRRANRDFYRMVGVVYQNPNYQLFMPSVREELLFGAADREYAMEMAERFGLTELLERHPHSLSEGQKRRVTIAAILAQQPKVLLLDEPTVGQDYEGLKQMVAVLNDVHREQHNTMITVTHDFRCAAALMDRALFIEDGIVKKSGGKELVEEFFGRSLACI